jgi:hypothetical protein
MKIHGLVLLMSLTIMLAAFFATLITRRRWWYNATWTLIYWLLFVIFAFLGRGFYIELYR